MPVPSAEARARTASTTYASARSSAIADARRGGRGASVAAVRGGGRLLGRCGDAAQVEDREVAVGADPVAPAVARVVARREVLDHLDADLGDGAGDAPHEEVALDVGVLLDLVRDLQGEQGEADLLVEGRGRQPVRREPAGEQPALRAAPEPHVVAAGRVALDLLLVGEVLLAVEQVQRADRCLGVAAAARDAERDPTSGAEVEVVGPDPAGRRQGRCTWPSQPCTARLTGSPSRPSLVRVRPMK